MAGIAIHAVVNITADVRVMEIGCIVVPMATCALERRIGCRGARVAIRANTARVSVIDVKEIVSKRRPKPIRRRVARRAGSRDDSDGGSVGGEVIRYRPAHRLGALPLSRVAAVAIRRRHGRTGVAQVAGHGDVRAGQGKTGRAVVKDRAEPRGRRVARRASGWITGSDVIRHRPAQRCGALPIRGVAAVAIGGQGPAVISTHMAKRAGYGRVRAGQREGCRAVIESGCRPICRGVADRTVRRKPGGNMIRHRAAKGRSALPGSQMAAIAGR